MSRTIKVRVWDSISKAYHYWGNIQSNRFNDFDLDHYTLEQYIGLRDKNEIEICEGDIIKAWHSEHEIFEVKEVKFENCTFTIGRYWKDGTHDWYSMEQYCSYELEVIGNIHENKDLLK
jgi:uncharacterized phage protein (TIGR01671 family)